MDQKTRNKIAGGLSAVLVPLMIYLLFANIGGAGKKRRVPIDTRQTSAVATFSSSNISKSVPNGPLDNQTISAGSKVETIDPEVLIQQKKIAASLPRRNPFAVTEKRLEFISSVAQRPQEELPDQIKITGFVSERGGRHMAVINGRMMGVGESIGKWTIVKINGKSVILDNGEKQMTVKARQ